MTRSPQRRNGFTLVELLVVISIIGILIGMLVVTVVPMITRTSEFAIHNEATQLTAAVEQFYTDHGFYPPSFDNPLTAEVEGIASAAEMLPYLNRIAPNHAEAISASGGVTPLELWWTTVGEEIGAQPGADLVFWLSGLLKNKQYPLTGGKVAVLPQDPGRIPVAYNLAMQADETLYQALGEPEPERLIYYEFNSSRLLFRNDTSGNPVMIAGSYEQPRGEQNTPFLYRDSAHYWFNANGDFNAAGQPLCQQTEAVAYYDGAKLMLHLSPPTPADFVPAELVFENPETFQIVTYGVDGTAADVGTTDPLNWRNTDKFSRDNITNFSEGTLEKMRVQ